MAARGKKSRIVTVVGARPQFIKAAAVTPALRAEGVQEVLVHTGQHYDWEMSASFFDRLDLPRPDYNLEIGSGPHGAQTGRMLEGIEKIIVKERPCLVLIYGDTNSTLAGALAAAKQKVPVAHVEAGLRSFDRDMPEEINRVVADHLSSILFAPTVKAVENLRREGITDGVVRTGDVMYDLFASKRRVFASMAKRLMKRYGLEARKYAFATVHRAENTDDKKRGKCVVGALAKIASGGLTVLWPVHPRSRELAMTAKEPGLITTKPLTYFETQALMSNAKVVLTDSGGLQKEAAFHNVPCVILRDRTEWVELVDLGFAVLGGESPGEIARTAAVFSEKPRVGVGRIYGDGNSSRAIAGYLKEYISCS